MEAVLVMPRGLRLCLIVAVLTACTSNTPRAAWVSPTEKGSPDELRGVREVCVLAGTPRPGHEAQWASAKSATDEQFQRYFDANLGIEMLRVVACKQNSVTIWLYVDNSWAVQTLLGGDCKGSPCFHELLAGKSGVDVLPAFTEAFRHANLKAPQH